MSDISDNGSFNLGLANIASQNYGPSAVTNQANTAANTQNQQAQAQAQQMQNKILAARMPMILAGLHASAVGSDDQSGVGGGGGGSAPTGKIASMSDKLQEAQDRSGTADDSILNPGAIDTALRSQYFVPAVTPQEQQALIRGWQADPTDQYGIGPKSVMARIEMRKMQQTTESQKNSRDDFDRLSAVTNAPDGQAMNVLQASHPEVYDAIQKKFKGKPDEDRNEEDEARLFSAHAAGAVHQYTGRAASPDKAGVYRDEATGIPVPGVEQVGLSKDEYLKYAHEAITPSVEMDDGNGGKIKVAPWLAAKMGGAKNINGPGDWIMVRASQSNLPGAGATVSPNSAQKQESRKVAQGALDTAQQQQATKPADPTNGEPKPVNGVGTASRNGVNDPKLTDALHDTKYDYKPTNNGEEYKPQIGHSPPPNVLDDMQKQTTARNGLAKDSSDGIKSASAALTMYQAAQDILAKGNYDGGAWNARLAATAGKYLPVGFQQAVGKAQSTGDYQELTKTLGTAALQAGKGIFAKMTQMEANMLKNELSPSPSMNPQAMKDMIQKGMNIAQYSVDSAKRVPSYLHAGKDANQFGTWNQEYFPQETETKVTAKQTGGAGTPKYTDEQVKGYMSKHGLKDEQATRKALGM